jgi:hypothetical protein
MVTLSYEPQRWFNEPKEIIKRDEWDWYSRCGKMYYMHDKLFPSMVDFIGRSVSNGPYRPDHILIVIWPGEVGIPEPEEQILHKVLAPDGMEMIWICII